jgi:hypothetical protein
MRTRSPGRAAAQPPPGWRPAARRDGLRVWFVSENGSQRRLFDFGTLSGQAGIALELAAAFETVTGPLGRWKRAQSAKNLWLVARRVAAWLATSRPGLTSLGGLSVADARVLGLSLQQPSGDQQISVLRALLAACPTIRPQVTEALATVRGSRTAEARQPYQADELRHICVVARGIVRRARQRLRTNWALVNDLRGGRLDVLDPRDSCRVRAAVLDQAARLNSGTAPDADAQSLLGELHLSTCEAWAFAVLLAALTGLNASILDELPADHLQATADREAGVALVDASKPRRGSRSAMTLPLSALRPPPGDTRRPAVLNTSLTTGFGVYRLLVELTAPARAVLGDRRAFVYYAGDRPQTEQPVLRAGVPSHLRLQRQRWLRGWLTGQAEHDALLVGISLDRLRKTFLHEHRRPVAHTPDTLARYLRRMRAVTEEGFQIVRDALEEQVSQALARWRMTVTPVEESTDQGAGQDTVLAACSDFEHSPMDAGRSCRQTFLTCLDCTNARAFPRHLPVQLLVLDELLARRATMTVTGWVDRYAGRVAQLEQVIAEYESAQRDHARTQISDADRQMVTRLLAGDLDPP